MADDPHYLMVSDNRQLLDPAGSHYRPSLERLKIGGYSGDVPRQYAFIFDRVTSPQLADMLSG